MILPACLPETRGQQRKNEGAKYLASQGLFTLELNRRDDSAGLYVMQRLEADQKQFAETVAVAGR